MTRKPKLFLCRKIGNYPNAGIHLGSDGRLQLQLYGLLDCQLPRSIARLLAKRILQALEEK